MILRELWTLVRDAVLLLRSLPDLLADWCDRQVMFAHRPAMVPADPPARPGLLPADRTDGRHVVTSNPRVWSPIVFITGCLNPGIGEG